MNDKKRVLIVSCSVGHGHYYTAEAIKNTFLLNYHHIEVEHIDFLNFIGIFSKKVYFDSFYPIARYLPKLCKFIYYNTDNVIGKKIFNLITNFSKKINTNRYFEYISNYQPDYVLCSHFIPADIIKNYSVKHKFNFRVGTLMTDYAIHELQKVSRDIDYYVVNDDINKELLSTGVSQKNIIVSGIPINPKFMEKINIDDILVKYRIDIVKKTIVILPSVQEIIKVEEIISFLFSSKYSMNLIAIIGSNGKLYNKLKEYMPPKSINYQLIKWSNNIDEYMRIADIIITKPGGITVTECIYLGKPMLLINPIPGQEEYNAKYVINNGYGLKAYTMEEFKKNIQLLFSGFNVKKESLVKNPNDIICGHIISSL